jgi:hypothetical protein
MTSHGCRFAPLSMMKKRPAVLALALGLALGATLRGSTVEGREPAPTTGLDS